MERFFILRHDNKAAAIVIEFEFEFEFGFEFGFEFEFEFAIEFDFEFLYGPNSIENRYATFRCRQLGVDQLGVGTF